MRTTFTTNVPPTPPDTPPEAPADPPVPPAIPPPAFVKCRKDNGLGQAILYCDR